MKDTTFLYIMISGVAVGLGFVIQTIWNKLKERIIRAEKMALDAKYAPQFKIGDIVELDFIYDDVTNKRLCGKIVHIKEWYFNEDNGTGKGTMYYVYIEKENVTHTAFESSLTLKGKAQ